MLPAMIKSGFPTQFGAGVIASSGGLGILVPPSIVMVMYGVSTNSSIGALFMAGVIPGVVLAAILLGVTWYRARKNSYPREKRATWRERFLAFKEAIWGLLLILVVIGGIYSGIFTPTEAAAVSAVYAFIIVVFVYKNLSLQKIPTVLLSSANMSAMLLYIITNAILFSFLLTHENIPQTVADWLVENGLGTLAFLLAVNVILLIMGNFMEPSSIILITTPILFPIAVSLGIDPIHFGVMITVNMEIGMITPPVGLNLYVASSISRLGMTEMTLAVWPWLVAQLFFLGWVTYWPAMSLWLPRTLGMID
jgi:C4-dicarboxylate transporter DctM subunit